jgi:hypothetical protein
MRVAIELQNVLIVFSSSSTSLSLSTSVTAGSAMPKAEMTDIKLVDFFIGTANASTIISLFPLGISVLK